MVDKTEAIYRKDRMRGTTWVEATRTLYNMGSELEQQVDGLDYEGVKESIAQETANRVQADTQLGVRITNEVSAREQADTQLGSRITAETSARGNADTALGNRIDKEITDRIESIDNLSSELDSKIQNESSIREQADNDIKATIANMEQVSTNLGASVADLQTNVAENTGNITALTGRVGVTESEINDLNTSLNELESQIPPIVADVEGIKGSLVSDVVTKGGTTTGTIVVELEFEDGTKITAPDFNYGKVTSIELLQGTSAGMMKAQFTLSDGTTVYSNDFQVLEQVVGDVYITSFTFKNGSSQGKISATIGLSDGRTLDANDFQLPTDPQITANISDLLSRMTSVEQVNSTQNNNITALDTRLSTAEGKITTNENDIAGLKSADQTINGEIASLDQRVTNIEDTPGVSIFQNGKAGTIVGSSDVGKISANSDGTGSVNGFDSKADLSDLDYYYDKAEADDLFLKEVPIGGTNIGGVKNGGNVIIESDGTMNSLSSSKQLVTSGDITQFVILNEDASICEVIKDFDIEYIRLRDEINSLRVTISKGKYINTINKEFILGYLPITQNVSYINCSLKHGIIVRSFGGESTIIYTNEITLTDTETYYYRMYV